MKKIVLISLNIVIVLFIFSIVYAVDFTDFGQSHWAYPAVSELVSQKVINGYSDGTFKPEKQVTRAELSKMLVRSLNLTNDYPEEFGDVTKDHWAYNDIQIMSRYLSPHTINSKQLFEPDIVAKREEAAVALVRALKLDDSKADLKLLNRFSDKDLISKDEKANIAIALEHGLIKGNDDNTFNPDGTLTRAQSAQLIINALNFKSSLTSDIRQEEPTIKETSKDKEDTKIEEDTEVKETSKDKEDTKIEEDTKVKETSKDKEDTKIEEDTKAKETSKDKEDTKIEKDSKIKLDDSQKQALADEIVYNSETGLIDLGPNYSNLTYGIAYGMKEIGDTYFTDTKSYNPFSLPSNHHPVTDRFLSVKTSDLGTFAGPQCYVPFILISYQDEYKPIKTIDTRADIKKYLKKSIIDYTQPLSPDVKLYSSLFEFKNNINYIEVYVTTEDGDILTESNGLQVDIDKNVCYVRFVPEPNKTYEITLNATFLEGELAILTPISQKISFVKESSTSDISKEDTKTDEDTKTKEDPKKELNDSQKQALANEIVYNPETGLIDLGPNYSNLTYGVAYGMRKVGDTYFTDTKSYNPFSLPSNHHPITSRFLSVKTSDLGNYGGSTRYVPFILISYQDEYKPIKTIDTRVDVKKYLKKSMDDYTTQLSQNPKLNSFPFEFKNNIKKIEVYVTTNDGNILTESNGLQVDIYDNICYVRFVPEHNKTYEITLNATLLEGEFAILTPISQKITFVEKTN